MRQGYCQLKLQNGERNTLHATDFDNQDSIVLKLKFIESPFPIYSDSPSSVDQISEFDYNIKNVYFLFFFFIFLFKKIVSNLFYLSINKTFNSNK